VASEADVKALISQTVAAFGRLDYAHNNAGIERPPAPLTEMTEDNWDHVLIAGLHGTRQHGAYGVSKVGVISLTKTAALENGASGVRVNAVCPGAMSGTAMWDYSRKPFSRTAGSCTFISRSTSLAAVISAFSLRRADSACC
jgi:NAD(P)-dependent dehydrogenase (short-subunit alcohol dehydrogenase family)